MKLYNFKRSTGELIYHYDNKIEDLVNYTIADKDPQNKDRFLIPANATTEEPLDLKDGFAVCFISNIWVYKTDNRLKTYFINGQKVVFNLGDEITNDMTLEQFTNEELFNTAKNERVASIDSQTSVDIEAIAGDNNKQMEKLMLGNLLIRRENLGSITSDESATLNTLDALGVQIKQLKVDGNAREQQVQNLIFTNYTSLADAILAVEII